MKTYNIEIVNNRVYIYRNDLTAETTYNSYNELYELAKELDHFYLITTNHHVEFDSNERIEIVYGKEKASEYFEKMKELFKEKIILLICVRDFERDKDFINKNKSIKIIDPKTYINKIDAKEYFIYSIEMVEELINEFEK